MYVNALIQMKAGVAQRAHQLPQELVVPQQALQIKQLEDARANLDGLVMQRVMMPITTWTAVMMAETVADVTSTHNTAQIANALILMEAGVEQLALNRQLHLLYLQFLDPLVIQLKSFILKIIKSS